MVQLGAFPKPGVGRDAQREGELEDGRGKKIVEKDRSFLEEVAQRGTCSLERRWPCCGGGQGEEKLKERPC